MGEWGNEGWGGASEQKWDQGGGNSWDQGAATGDDRWDAAAADSGQQDPEEFADDHPFVVLAKEIRVAHENLKVLQATTEEVEELEAQYQKHKIEMKQSKEWELDELVKKLKAFDEEKENFLTNEKPELEKAAQAWMDKISKVEEKLKALPLTESAQNDEESKENEWNAEAGGDDGAWGGAAANDSWDSGKKEEPAWGGGGNDKWGGGGGSW